MCVVYVLVHHVDSGTDEERLSHKLVSQGPDTAKGGVVTLRSFPSGCGEYTKKPAVLTTSSGCRRNHRNMHLWDDLRTSAAHIRTPRHVMSVPVHAVDALAAGGSAAATEDFHN